MYETKISKGKEDEMNKRLEKIKSLINRPSENVFTRQILYYDIDEILVQQYLA